MYLTVELGNHHNKKTFKCTEETLNNYLKLQAKKESKAGLAKVYVLADEEDNVMAYYTLSASELPKDAVPENLLKKLPRSYNGYPAILIGRLAVDEMSSGQGVGGELLVDAIERCVNYAEKIGTSVIMVDPLNNSARKFYEKFMFKSLPDHNRMILKIDHNLKSHFND